MPVMAKQVTKWVVMIPPNQPSRIQIKQKEGRGESVSGNHRERSPCTHCDRNDAEGNKNWEKHCRHGSVNRRVKQISDLFCNRMRVVIIDAEIEESCREQGEYEGPDHDLPCTTNRREKESVGSSHEKDEEGRQQQGLRFVIRMIPEPDSPGFEHT